MYTDDFATPKTQADIDALAKAVLSDFRVGLTYKVAQRIGEAKASGGNPVTYDFSDRFELKLITVTELNMNVQFLEFQNNVQYGRALDPIYVAPTTVAVTTVPPTTVPVGG